MNNEQARADQISEGRRQLSVPNTTERKYPKPANKPSSKVIPKGHEAFLKALESSSATVTFEKASSGAEIIGIIMHSDKYTVSVFDGQKTRVLFKHDISEFSTESTRGTVVAQIEAHD